MQKEDRLLRGRQIAYMIYEYFRATGEHESTMELSDLLNVSREWGEVLLSIKDTTRISHSRKCVHNEDTGLRTVKDRMGPARSRH